MPQDEQRMWLNIEKNCILYEDKFKNYLQMRNRKQCQVQVLLKHLSRSLAITHTQKNSEYETLLNEKNICILNRKSTLAII